MHINYTQNSSKCWIFADSVTNYDYDDVTISVVSVCLTSGDKTSNTLPSLNDSYSHSLPSNSVVETPSRRLTNENLDGFLTPPNPKLRQNYSLSEPHTHRHPNPPLNVSGSLTRQNSKLQNTANFNWSPDVVLSQHYSHGNCRHNIITGAPLLARERKPLQGLQSREVVNTGRDVREVNRERDRERGENSKIAPLLTLRDRGRSKRGGFWANGGSSHALSLPELQGCRLAEQPSAVARSLGSSNAYSHHNTSIQSYSRAPIPDNEL